MSRWVHLFSTDSLETRRTCICRRHADYPMNGNPEGFGDRAFPRDICLGVEFLTMVDSFSELNGATMLVPGSREFLTPPPGEYATAYPEGAEHVCAPAGTVLLFDAKMWHRAHRNRSDGDRCAILNNVLPQWVMPMIDQAPCYDEFILSGKADASLTQRERRDTDKIMQNVIGGKPIRTYTRERL